MIILLSIIAVSIIVLTIICWCCLAILVRQELEKKKTEGLLKLLVKKEIEEQIALESFDTERSVQIS